jgi:hypothetical protein
MTAAVERELRTQLRAHPDLTLWELQQWLRQQTRTAWSQSLVWLCLQRLWEIYKLPSETGVCSEFSAISYMHT